MDIELLKTFLEVHQSRNFTRAADRLYLTPAAVSARVRQLERHLGVNLFVRERSNVTLTSEGERLLPHVEALLINWSRTVQEIGLKQEQTRRLYLGTTSGLWQFSLSAKLKTIIELYPDLAIRAEAADPSELVSRIMNRTLDLAFSYEPPAIPELKSVKIGQIRLGMVSSIEGTSLSSAMGNGYIYVDWGTSFAMFHAKKFGEISPAALYVDLAIIALTYLEQSPGTAYLPVTTIEQNEHLHMVKGAPEFRRPVYASYRANFESPEILLKIIEVLGADGNHRGRK